MWTFIMAAFVILALGTEYYSHVLRTTLNPEVLLNASQIILYWKYPLEEHEVETADSYILTLHRIPYGRTGQRPVIFLQHGLLSSTVSWISNLPNSSLAFILADAGFDVWMGNSRGNTYSRKHATLSTNSKEYWAFSFDEMVRYDRPASIDYIVKKTGQKIYYVGHSQGTLLGFLAFSTLPQLAQKVKASYALAPGISLKYGRSLPFRLLFMIRQSVLKLLLGDKDFLPETVITKFLVTDICNNKIISIICDKIIFELYGFEPKNLNMVRCVSFSSSQMLVTCSFYVRDNPYDILFSCSLSVFTQVPTALWSGQKDLVTNPEDVAILVPQIPNLIYHKILPTYNHLDFLFSLNAPQKIYNEIIEMIKKTP
uniref:Lipase n=1 Tax=Monodelphis domestica TaxID=13616 RepID=A0A5F8GWW6_MONDO